MHNAHFFVTLRNKYIVNFAFFAKAQDLWLCNVN